MNEEQGNREVLKRLFSPAEWRLLEKDERFKQALKGIEIMDDLENVIRLGLDLIERARLGSDVSPNPKSVKPSSNNT